MIIPAFFVASMVGFHVEFSQSMYSSKCPYSTPISCTRVTGPSVYWRSSWARASSESEEAARHVDKIIVLIIFMIFSSPNARHLYSANARKHPPDTYLSPTTAGQSASQRQYVLRDAPAYGTICRKEPVFAGKVTCGVRSETSGQSWPSNTVATDRLTGLSSKVVHPVSCRTVCQTAQAPRSE